MTVSALDGVPGLGESKRKALLAQFGSVKGIKAATAGGTDRRQGDRPVPGRARSSGTSAGDGAEAAATVPAVNMTTGEILET